jgi:hypothetical protein
MSNTQIINLPASSPSVPTQFTADDGTLAIPVANNLNLYADQSSENNNAGIVTSAIPDLSDTIYIRLTNRVNSVVITSDATPTELLSFPLGVFPGVILAEGSIIAYDALNNAGAAYTFVGAAVTDGVTGTEISIENKNVFEQALLSAIDFDLSIVGNNAVITVTGLPGVAIQWSCFFTYKYSG